MNVASPQGYLDKTNCYRARHNASDMVAHSINLAMSFVVNMDKK
jgi:hypothetical protein